MYQRLVVYNKEHNHTMVPMQIKEDLQLGRWVFVQRYLHRDKKMTEERKRLLDSIGFAWELSTKNKATWKEMYQRLVAYKKEHKRTIFPTKYKEDPQLGCWVNTQRVVYRDKKMTEERKHLLNSIGFLWELRLTTHPPWEEIYQRLVAYKKKHMHTVVPTKYKEDPQLAGWVHNQRKAYKKKKMLEKRKLLF